MGRKLLEVVLSRLLRGIVRKLRGWFCILVRTNNYGRPSLSRLRQGFNGRMHCGGGRLHDLLPLVPKPVKDAGQ